MSLGIGEDVGLARHFDVTMIVMIVFIILTMALLVYAVVIPEIKASRECDNYPELDSCTSTTIECAKDCRKLSGTYFRHQTGSLFSEDRCSCNINGEVKQIW